MQRRAEQAGFEDAGDSLVERIVAHDEIYSEKPARRPRGFDHAARVCECGRERLFTKHMLTCVERGDSEFAVRRGRRSDVDDLYIVARGECVDVRADRQAKFLAPNSRRQKRPNAPQPSRPTPSFAPDVSVSVNIFMALELSRKELRLRARHPAAAQVIPR